MKNNKGTSEREHEAEREQSHFVERIKIKNLTRGKGTVIPSGDWKFKRSKMPVSQFPQKNSEGPLVGPEDTNMRYNLYETKV